MQNIDEVLLRKHCKEGAFVATQFLINVFLKKPKKQKKTKKTQKYVFDVFAASFPKNLN